MTKENNKNTTRSTLTLKLKAPLASEPKTLALKKPDIDNKKISKSAAVQVTIKGRKKDSKEEPKNLDQSEVAARFRAVSNSKNSLENDEINSVKILSKTLKEQKQAEIAAADEEAKIKSVTEKPSLAENQKIDIVEEKATNKNTNLSSKLTSDNFDVINKIKQSIAITNREKEEREKIVSARKKLEQEKLEKERLEKEKKLKQKKPEFNSSKSFDSDKEEVKKGKPNFREERINQRKLTYIIDGGGDEDGSDISRKRKRHKIKQLQQLEQQKEYKKIAREVILPELIAISDLADRMSEKTGDVVKKLFTMGMVATSNQVIDADTAELIITEFGHTAKRVASSDVENILDHDQSNNEQLFRAPIVTIMGHVDHGKTSLLDAIRATDIVSGEHGGITQHIGASRIQTADGKFITFLDTPGHEAFTEMRSRGANVTDIVVLVVAADDGVKAQTIEAINHAKAANVPIIVAINKIDKAGGDPRRVKNELLSHNIVAEDLGGDVIFVEVSAKNKLNLDKLEEAILLQAEVLELKAAYSGKSSGTVVESRIDPAKGVVATVLVLQGTLDLGDLIVVGTSFGKIRKMIDDKGKSIKQATPGMPVEILGLNQAPNAGDKFVEVDEERQAREIIAYRSRKEKESKALKNSVRSVSDIFKDSSKGGLKYLNIILKGDVNGSVEALQGSILKLNNEEVAIKIIHQATGGITETDVSLAAVSQAIIIGFNVRANNSAVDLAKLKAVDIRYYSIIYNVIDDLKLMLSGMLDPTKNEEYLGKAEIRQIFKISGTGKIGGSTVIDGILKRSARVRLLREDVVIHDGILKTLKRFKEDVKEVKSGFECGIALENFEDIKEKDIVECYEIVEQKRSL
ncbi:MAG: translation initiation factor IF-2 [Rickettsiales bacterium]|nr:translation initiation factor IF-2 [Rickettsiales bacterium]